MARRTKGDGSVYKRADGRWCASVENGYNADGTRRRKVLTAKTQAEVLAKLRDIRRQVEIHGSVPTGVPTVQVWLARWLDEFAAPRLAPRTVDGYRDKARHINASIGKIKLDKLTPAHVRQMHRYAASGGRSSTTALHCHRLLSTALKAAMREGLAQRNAAELAGGAPRAAATEAKALTVDQAKTLLRAAEDNPLAARWALALIYGMRQGEALGLTWDAVDYTDDTLDISWQLQRLTYRHGCGGICGAKRGADCPQRHNGIPAGMEHRHLEGAWFLTRPKRQKRRMVPLLPFAEATLRARQSVAANDPNPYGLVFARPDGRPFDPSLDNKAWHAWLEASGLPSIPLHAARHTAATLLMQLGADEATRMTILGHSTATTQRGYAHVDLGQQRAALARLDAALGG